MIKTEYSIETLSAVVYRMRIWERMSSLRNQLMLSPEEQKELLMLETKFEELTKN